MLSRSIITADLNVPIEHTSQGTVGPADGRINLMAQDLYGNGG